MVILCLIISFLSQGENNVINQYLFYLAPMKQTSLYDSFLKKNKTQQQDNTKGKTKAKNMEELSSNKHISKAKFTVDSDEEVNCNKSGTKLQKRTSIKMQTKKENGDQQKPNLSLDPEEKPNAQFTDSTPEWALPENCLDAEKRPPSHPDYDPTTLWIPENAWAKFTAPMKQFWNIKKQNFDKIILFKLGKFYELFYQDAMVGHKYLDLKFMGTKMHTGFPQKSLERYSNQFVKLGFKTVIVQQMQTPDQMNERVQKSKSKGEKSQKTLAREVTQILTKGTFNDTQNSSYLPNYLLSFQNHGNWYAFSLLQISSNQILIGVCEGLQKFKTMLYQTRPVEAIYDPDQIPFDLVGIMSQSFLSMQMSKIKNKDNLWHHLNSVCELQNFEKAEKMKRPKIFSLIDQTLSQRPKQLLYATLSGLFHYLKKVMKFDYVMNAVRFTFYEKEKASRNMVLDSQALQHLQIFETTEGETGSLLQTIDRTKSKFGKRLLRRWITSPLFNTYHINQRLNAVEDLQRFILERKKVADMLRKLPDLEKKINLLYHYAVKTTSASKAIYFEDLNKSRLKQFRVLFEHIENAWYGIQALSKYSASFTSTRLKQLVTLNQQSIREDKEDIYFEDEEDQSAFEGLLPNVMAHLEQFNSYVKWEDDKPIPQKGLVAFFDSLQDQISEVKNQLEEYLEHLRRELREPNLKFVHTKERFEIEISQKVEKKRPAQFVFTSRRAGYSRYACPTVRKIVKKLEKLEQSTKEQMGMFVGFFFQQFKKKQKYWQRFVEILAQLDCLISFSQYSFMNDKIRPEFHEDKFLIQNGRHPCLLSIDFIPNTVDMSKKKVILLTGPNMGGKSTLLRMVCLLSVLAQMGCYVTAEKYECSLVDRIFTRIGASDRLELGKSTFFTEMQETRSVLVNATPQSLAIIDELGRGTSTFDGMSIAYAVLKALVSKICCYSLFATHYHSLVEQFEFKAGIQLKMMDSRVRNNEILFLYKLVDGHVQKSFGLNVAKSVGINSFILKVAEQKASQMHKQIQDKRQKRYLKVMQLIQG